MANPELAALLAKGRIDAWNKNRREENTRYTGWPNLDSNPADEPDLETNWDGEILRTFADMNRYYCNVYSPAPQEMPVYKWFE